MTRCIVHIGMHRTGSTSIQESLRGFSDKRFFYAPLGENANHSLAMYSLYAPAPIEHHIHKSNGVDAATVADYIARMRADLERAVSDAKGRTLIISGEDISALPREGLVNLRDDFQKRFDDLTVVGYVRAPIGFMTSSFQHRISMGAVDQFRLDRQYRPYKMTFAVFDELFGRDRVNLWKFDVETFPGGCAVRDFCARLGIDLPPEKIARHNESLPRQTVALLYIYYRAGLNGASIMAGPERKRLLDCLAAVGNDPFRLSPEIVRPILEKNREDRAWMEARLEQTLDEGLGEHQPGDVRDESDLLRPDPVLVAKLLLLLGDRAPKDMQRQTPEEVAHLLHALRQQRNDQLAGSQSNYVGSTRSIASLLHELFRYLKSHNGPGRKNRP